MVPACFRPEFPCVCRFEATNLTQTIRNEFVCLPGWMDGWLYAVNAPLPQWHLSMNDNVFRK